MGEPTPPRNHDQDIPTKSGEEMGEREPLTPQPGPETRSGTRRWQKRKHTSAMATKSDRDFLIADTTGRIANGRHGVNEHNGAGTCPISPAGAQEGSG